MALSAETEALLGRYEAPAPAAEEPPAEDKPEPGMLESVARGAKQGLTFGFGDEISGALESAFSNKTYRQARDEARAADAAAKEAHPWGFGLSQVLGGVATGIATGGVAGAAAKLGTAGVAGLAGAEGALGAAGESEADLTRGDVGGLAKDTLVGGATGAVLGAGLHKVLGGYANTAIERRARHLTEDIAEGGVPTVKRRLGKVTGVDDAGNSMAVGILDDDKAFQGALSKGKKEATAVAEARLTSLGKEVKPAYAAIDEATGGVRFTDVRGALAQAIEKADVPGNSNIRDALAGTLKDLEQVTERKLAREGGAAAGVAARPLAGPAKASPLSKVHGELFGEGAKEAVVRRAAPGDLADARWGGKPLEEAGIDLTNMRGAKDLEKVRDAGRHPPTIAVTPEGRMDVVDGRHRILVARERGEPLKVRWVAARPEVDASAGADWPSPFSTAAPAAGGGLDSYQMPTQDVRAWVTRLLKHADASMGSLSETERRVVKDKVHEVAHDFLRDSLKGAAEANPALEAPVNAILEANRKMRVYSAVKDALVKSAERKHWSPSSLKDALSSAGLPGVAAVIGAGGSLVGGGAAFAAAKGAQAVGHALNRSATHHLATLVRAARAGSVTQAAVLEAIKAGVPVATANAVAGARYAVTPPGSLSDSLASSESP